MGPGRRSGLGGTYPAPTKPRAQLHFQAVAEHAVPFEAHGDVPRGRRCRRRPRRAAGSAHDIAPGGARAQRARRRGGTRWASLVGCLARFAAPVERWPQPSSASGGASESRARLRSR
jgi:hypothetical protein